MRKPQNKILVACLSIVVTAIGGYVGTLLYEEWSNNSPLWAEKSRQQQVTIMKQRLSDASRELMMAGVKFDPTKGYSHNIDLSSYVGTPGKLQPLQEMVLLKELAPGTQGKINLRLGPRIDDTFLPLLLSLDTLEVLEIGESPLSDKAQQQLKEKIPGLRFEVVKAFSPENRKPTISKRLN